jgi:hypothetical protein
MTNITSLHHKVFKTISDFMPARPSIPVSVNQCAYAAPPILLRKNSRDENLEATTEWTSHKFYTMRT